VEMPTFNSRRNADCGNNVDGELGCWGSGMVASGRGLWAVVFMNVVGSILPGNHKALARHPGRRHPCATPNAHGRIACTASPPRPLAMLILSALRHPSADCSHVSPA